MPWVRSVEEQRRQFVEELSAAGVNRRSVCRKWGVPPKTAYKWLRRSETGDGQDGGLRDRSRRPKRSPGRTSEEVEAAVLAVRDEFPSWGGRKLAAVLQRRGSVAVPSPSTITQILRRHGRITEEGSQRGKAWVRFQRERPNELWQMDFKGHFGLEGGGRSHPLVLLDDHSRFCLILAACMDERGATVQQELVGAFRAYGLPLEMLMDNGSPWGSDEVHVYTPFVVWLLRLGIRVTHGRIRHPQTQGKLERLNQTLDVDVLHLVGPFQDNAAVQAALDEYRPVYNEVRPHEALGMAVPASRYTPSERSYPEELPLIEYDAADTVRRVQHSGRLSYGGREYRIPKAFHGYPVALRPTETEGQVAVYFCQQRIAILDQKGGSARPVRG